MPGVDALLLRGVVACSAFVTLASVTHTLDAATTSVQQGGDRGNFHSISVEIECHSAQLIACTIYNHCNILKVFYTCM